MWYVIRTLTGKESELCMWINTCVDQSLFTRCFVPLYEDVTRRGGKGHITIRRMFDGYLFLESDTPERVREAFRKKPGYKDFLTDLDGKGEKILLPIRPEEEAFLDTVLTDGLMRVSYISFGAARGYEKIIGPLEHYQDRICKMSIYHRWALITLPFLGEDRRIKFCLWTNADPKLEWIEQEKENRKQKSVDPDIHIGDMVINRKGLFGDTPLEVVALHPNSGSLTVRMPIFGRMTKAELSIEDVLCCNIRADEGKEN